MKRNLFTKLTLAVTLVVLATAALASDEHAHMEGMKDMK